MKSRTIYLLVFLILVLAIVLLIKLTVKAPAPEGGNNISIFSPGASGVIFRESAGETRLPEKPLKILGVNISDGKPIQINGLIIIEFDDRINPSLVRVEITPSQPFNINSGANPNQINIEPIQGWAFDTTYKVKVFKTSAGGDKMVLDKDYEYSFKTVRYAGI